MESRDAHIIERFDTAPHHQFDSLTRTAALALQAPVSAVSLVDTSRVWFKSAIGAYRELPRPVSFCSHAIEGFEPLIVQDASRDLRFAKNPLVAGEPHIRFYAGAPLICPDGYALGALCVLDYRPRSLSLDELRLLGHLADAAMHAIIAHRQALDVRSYG
jgi:GAF domain-containing protein